MASRIVASTIIALLISVGTDAVAEDFCGDILRFGVFEKYESLDTRLLVSQSQRLYCNSSAASNESSTAFGFNVATVIEALPVEFGGHYRDKDANSWRQSICQYDWNKLTDWSTKRVSVVAASHTIASAWSRCVEAQQNGVVAGVKFSTPTDFSLTVQMKGLPTIPTLSYSLIYPVRSGIAFVPAEAAKLVDPFGIVSKEPSREHTFRGKRHSLAPFDILIASKPNAARLSVPSWEPPQEKPLPPFSTKYLADAPSTLIEGQYSPPRLLRNKSNSDRRRTQLPQ